MATERKMDSARTAIPQRVKRPRIAVTELHAEDGDPYESEAAPELSLHDIGRIARRRWRWIVAFALLGLLTAAICLRPRDYEATGSLRIQPGLSSMYRTSPSTAASGDVSDKIASESEILQSKTLYLKVATTLDLANRSEFWGSAVPQQSIDNPLIRARLLRRMESRIKIERGPRDELVTISCTTSSAELSARIVNTLIDDYIEFLFQMRFGANQRTSNWLIGQLGGLQKQLETDQTTLAGLQSQLGIVGMGDQDRTDLSVASLDALNRASSEATIQRIVAEAKFRNLSGSDPGLIEAESQPLSPREGTSSLGLLQTLRSSQAQAATDYARLQVQFGVNYPEVLDAKAQLEAVDRQVAAEEARIVNQAKLAYQAATANEDMTTREFARQKTAAFQSRDARVKYAVLLHEYQSHRTLYEGLVQRLREAGITSGMESGEVDIVDLADVPGLPNPPAPPLVLGAGLFAGTIAGCVIGLLMEFGSPRINSIEAAERVFGSAALAVLPRTDRVPFSDTGGAPVAAMDDPSSPYAEAVQILRTKLLLALPRGLPQVLLVTSAGPGDGKSTVARNLATALAQHGHRVLLIDCDLRGRGLSGSFAGTLDAPGVSEILQRRARYEDALLSLSGGDGLYLLPAGATPAQPAVLLASPQMADLVSWASAGFDYVLLDGTPLPGLADALNLAQHADALLLIVRERSTHTRALRLAGKAMQAAKIRPLGMVFNDADLRFAGHGRSTGPAPSFDRKTRQKEGL